METEYMYWLVTTKFDMHDSSAGCKKEKTEWCPNTKEILKAQDLAVYNLIKDPKYVFPTILLNEDYTYYTFKTSNIKSF